MKSYVHMPSNCIDDFNRAAKARERERHLERERKRLARIGESAKPLGGFLLKKKAKP